MTTLEANAQREARPVAPVRSVLTPLGLGEVSLAESGFWGTKTSINASATIWHCLYWQEKAGWLGNFDAAAEGTLPGARRGREFSDSEAYKLLEAMSWQYGVKPDAELGEAITSLIARIGRAQERDGYLNTNFGRPGQQPRYSDLTWGHELYNYGHLLQAAVARYRTTGPDELFEIATKVADHICGTFGPDGMDAVCGHPAVEVGLAEFGRMTGEERYIAQAKVFIDRRGRKTLPDIEWGRAYFQDDMPIREATVFRGHAVRALYLSAGAVDVAIETGDDELLAAIQRQWARTVATRTYLTGGMGSHHQDEAFGEDYELPSDRAYCETCAGVASIMVSWRLLLATGESKYADLIERTLFNVVATSPAPDGRSFFYANTLHRRAPGDETRLDQQSPRASSTMRAPWFDVSCCPHNVARTFASLGAYVSTVTGNGLQVHQFVPGDISTRLDDGRAVGVRIDTRYPADGDILIRVLEAPGDEWTLSLRVPAWASGASVSVDGKTQDASPGVVDITRRFAVGDEIRLVLPVEPRFTLPEQRVDAVRGTVAVEVGPVVYCLESVDLPSGDHVDDFTVDPESPRREGETIVVSGTLSRANPAVWPYGSAPDEKQVGGSVDASLIPYHLWATRGPSTMRVWIRRG